MGNSMINDSTISAARLALDGLSLRQQTISQNLANVDTPGYKAKNVQFENTLRRVLGMDASKKLEIQTTNASHLGTAATLMTYQQYQREGGSERADENNVAIDTELIDMSETGIKYQAISQITNKRFQLLKTLSQSR